METGKLINILIKQGLISKSDKGKIGIVPYESAIHRRSDKTSLRFKVTLGSKPRFSVKYLPKSWDFRLEDIVNTYRYYSDLKSIRVPNLEAHFNFGGGYIVVEEFLQDATPLDKLVVQRSVSGIHAADLLRRIFSELHTKGSRSGAKFLKAEKAKALDQIKSFLQEGIWCDIILRYVGEIIDKHASALRVIHSSGDIIDRNILQANGAWYLVDFEYSHQTIFGFKEAYRNILYSEWARNLTLHDLYPPLGDFPSDVAAMIALGWENRFQTDLLDDEHARLTRRHLRYLFWNVIDPAILPQLDRRASEAEGLAAAKEAELESIRRQLESTTQQHV